MLKILSKTPKLYIVLFLLPLASLFIDSNYILDMMVMVFIWGGIATAWNISGGFAGQFSLGHAGFLGIGAYTSALLLVNYNIPVIVGMLIGGLVAATFAFLTSILFLRLRGPFFVLATIAFAELIHISVNQLRGITQGAMGVTIPYEPSFFNFIFTGTQSYIFLTFAFLLVVYTVTYYIRNTKTGYYLFAIKDDVEASKSLGINVTRLKTLAFCVSAFFTAIGGSLLASYLLFIEPENVLTLDISIKIAMIAIVGGMYSPAGPIIGAIIIVPLEIFLRGFSTAIPGLDLLFFGVILILVVLFKPKGVVDGMDTWFDNFFGEFRKDKQKPS